MEVQYPAVFSLNSSGFEAWPCVHFDAVQDVEFLKLPGSLKTTNSVQVWTMNPDMQKTMAAFGSNYKKHKAYETTGKVNNILMPKHGQEISEKMFSDVTLPVKSTVLDISSVSTSWNTTSWAWGYSAEYWSVSMPPTSAALLRVVCLGEVEVFAWDVNSLTTGFKEIGKTATNMDEVVEAVKVLTDQDMAALVAKGCKGYYTVMTKDLMHYVPAGWLIAERSKVGPLVYGVRKSIMFKTASALESYSTSKELLARASHDVSKMEFVCELMSPK